MMHQILRAAVLSVILMVGLVNGTAPASAAVVSSIVVEGNSRVSDDTVRAYVTVQPGQSYGPGDVDESIDALFATGLFANVSIRQSGNSLVVTVVENATINRVSFEGNRKIDDARLEAVVQSTSRSVFSRGQVQSDTQRILEAYRRRGNYRASVTPQTIDRGQGRVDLIFLIDEGPRANVERITFVGNNSFSDSRLRDVIKTKESGLLGFIRSTDVYDPDRLQADQELLRRFYFNRGFADFRLISAVADYDRERNAFFITFTLDEGERYEFGTVRVDTTLADLDPAELERKVDSRPGRRYSAEKVEKSIEDLTLAANRRGYPFADVTPVGERNFTDGTIDVVYRVDQGTRAFIERIDIVGNTTTRDYVIRREFDIAEGDAYNRVLIDRAERRLRALGYFETVRISTSPGSEPDRVIVTVFVTEQATGKISVGFGYSTSEGVVGEISMEERNFLGRGQYLKGAITGSFEKQSAEVSFTEPYLFGYRLAGGFDLYTRRADETDDSDYTSNETGGTLRLGVPLTEETSVQVFYTLFNRDVSVRENDCRDGDLSLAICDSEGSRITSMLGTSLTYNSLDDQFNPREGLYGQLKTEVAGLGGDTYFIRGTAKGRAYTELLPAYGLIGMAALEGGAMQALNDDLQIQDQFFLGGSKVRGFSSAGIGPRDRATGDALGGRYYVAGTLEATFPIPFLPPEVGLMASGFTDAGSLWSVDPDIADRVGARGIDSNDFALRASAGVGVTWSSPFGPIRADVAFPLLQESEDETQIFRLSGGTRF